MNPFSPPPPTGSAMSNPHAGHQPHGSFFSPVSIPANITPGPAIQSPVGPLSHSFAFHLPRQSISMPVGPPNPNEWDPYGSMYNTPIQQQPTPPMGGSGVWSPPFGMRNGSPNIMGMAMHGHSPSQSMGMHIHSPNIHVHSHVHGHGNSASQFNAGYHPMESPIDPYVPHLIGQERFHHQQVRRGSPLAQVRQQHVEPDVQNPRRPGPAIDAPVPKHRHQISVTLQQEFENSEAYQREEAQTALEESKEEIDGEGFATNPVSPAPVEFPQQPEMPSIETDVHNGPELASNPDDDPSELEVEQTEEAKAIDASSDYINMPFNPEHTQLQRPDVQQQTLPPEFMPQSQYAHPHSREQSLSQLQHDFDDADPVQHSAMSMLMVGDGLGSGGHHHRQTSIHDELLSEDGRTNISDIVTNPSEPPSPRGKFSASASHVHQNSNNSNVWAAEHTKNVPSSATSSASKPKFNANAAEFKFDPSTSFNFVPKGNLFTPLSQTAPSTDNQSNGAGIGFGVFGAGIASGSFLPSLSNTGAYAPLFEKGAAAFSPNAPSFAPSFAAPASPTPPSSNAIFGDIVKPPPVKKVIPIVRPPSRLQVHSENTSTETKPEERREDTVEGGRKRIKHGPALSTVEDIEVPAFEAPSPDEMHTPKPQKDVQASEKVEDRISESSDEGERLMKSPLAELLGSPVEGEAENVQEPSTFVPFEFQNKSEAESFANADFTPIEQRNSKINTLGLNELSAQEASIVATSSTFLTPSQTTIAGSALDTVEEKMFTFNNPGVTQEFSFKPTAQEFNFEFPKPTSPPKKIFSGGLTESRYAHTPSPPPTQPAPPPPVLGETSIFLLPRQETSFDENIDPEKMNAFGEPVSRPMPTDAELDEVIKYMDKTENCLYSSTLNRRRNAVGRKYQIRSVYTLEARQFVTNANSFV
jgi:hypothetical protein